MHRPLRLVLDTNVLVAALRSRSGASSALVGRLNSGAFTLVASVPLLLEYESVMLRPEHVAASGRDAAALNAWLDQIAEVADRVPLYYRWRPQLVDAADELVLEAAVNGRADAIVTFNVAHLAPAARFGIGLSSPAAILRRLSP